MPYRYLFLFCLLPTLLQAAPQQDRGDLAYSLGARLGERLRGEVPDLELQALLDGIRDAYRNNSLRLPAERIDQLLDEHETHLQQEALAQHRQQAQSAQEKFFAKERAIPGTRELAGGVLVRELQPGTGRMPLPSSRVSVRYRGELIDGSLFDQSEGPQWFRLNSLIKGWQTALQAMPKGAKWRVVIPAEQAYGRAGAGDMIPPDAPLVFDVELLDVAD